MENEQNVKLNVFVNEKDYRRVLFWHSKRTIYSILLTLFVSIPIIFFLIGFGDGIKSLNFESLENILRLGLIILFSMLLIFLLMILFSIWKQTKTLTKLAEETRFTFSENGLESECRLCSFNMTWERFTKICETETDFVVFPQENMFYPIPKRFFRSHIQINEFKKLVSEKLGDKAEFLN